jgi:hypothetical protein
MTSQAAYAVRTMRQLRPFRYMRTLSLFALLVCISSVHLMAVADEYPDEFFTPAPAREPEVQPQQDEDGTPMLGVYMGGHGDDGEGVVIVGVIPGTAADRMGLRTGDVIRSVNGRTIDSHWTLVDQVINSGIGDDVQVQVTRDDEALNFADNFSKRPSEFGDIKSEDFSRQRGERKRNKPRGLMQRLQDALSDDDSNQRNRQVDEKQLEKDLAAIRQKLDQHSPLLHALRVYNQLNNPGGFAFHYNIDVNSEMLAQQSMLKHKQVTASMTPPPPFDMHVSCHIDADHL